MLRSWFQNPEARTARTVQVLEPQRNSLLVPWRAQQRRCPWLSTKAVVHRNMASLVAAMKTGFSKFWGCKPGCEKLSVIDLTQTARSTSNAGKKTCDTMRKELTSFERYPPWHTNLLPQIPTCTNYGSNDHFWVLFSVSHFWAKLVNRNAARQHLTALQFLASSGQMCSVLDEASPGCTKQHNARI